MIRFVEAKVRSLKDQTLYTGAEHYELIDGEVFVGVFKSEQTLEAFEDVGIVEVVDESIPVEKVFPVIPLGATQPTYLETEHGEQLPLSGGLEDKHGPVDNSY